MPTFNSPTSRREADQAPGIVCRDTTAMILAGGLGTRLRAAVPGRQKVIVPVAGRPFLLRLLDQLHEVGVRKVVICTGYQAGQVVEALGERYRSMRLVYSEESEPLGTAGALRQALPHLDSEPVLVLNGDSFCELDFPALLAARDAPATIVVREVPDTTQGGRVEFEADGVVTRFAEKEAERSRGWISAGIYLLRREVIERIPTDRAVSIEREVFPLWVGRGLRVFRASGRFLDIGTPDSYIAAQGLFS